MKKTIVILVVSLVMISGLFAFDGNTSASFAYTYEDGNHYLGLNSDSLGYFDSSVIGYYAGVDATFNISDINDWDIGMIVGPSCRYAFGDSGVRLNVALGLSAEGTLKRFSCGVGTFFEAEWRMTNNFGFGVGAKLGNDFFTVDFDNGDTSFSSRFFVSPFIGVEFYY